MDIEQLKATDYKVFDSYGESKGRAIAAIKYAEKFCSLTNTDAKGWDMLSLLKSGDKITFDKTKINEMIIKYREIAPKRETKLTTEQIQILDKLYLKRGASSLETMKNRLREIESNAQYEYNQYLSYLQQAVTKRKEIEVVESTPKRSYADMVAAIEATGFWEFHGAGGSVSSKLFITNNLISFKTKNDVIISYVNEKAKAKHQVNFGKFICHYDVGSGNVYAEREYEGQGVYPYCMHPHITSSGNVCIGEMKPDFISAKSSANLIEIFNIFQKVLLSYYDNSCYETIESIAKRSVDGCVNLPKKKTEVKRETANTGEGYGTQEEEQEEDDDEESDND